MIFSFIITGFFNKYKSTNSIKITDFYLLICLISITILWFVSAPEIRYGMGPLISLPCFTIILLFKKLNLIENFFNKNIKLSLITGFLIMGTLCLLFISKSFTRFQFNDLFIKGKVVHTYAHIEKIGKFSNNDYFWGKFLCADFREICVNTVKENYVIDEIFNYKVYKSDSRLKE